MANFKKEILIIFLLLLAGCVDVNYFMQSQTPPKLEGFLGLRWTTPMSIVNKEFSKRTGAKPLEKLNTYNTSVFTNVKFLDKQIDICRFTFDENGLLSIDLIFNTTRQSYKSVFNYYKDRLNEIYGDSNNLNLWFARRLELLLLPNYNVEINAYRIRSFSENQKVN